MTETVKTADRTFVTELVKGIPSYSVVDADGNVIARSHRVHVQGTYTLVVGGKWNNAGPEADMVAALKAMC